MTLPATLLLGKKPAVEDPRTLRLSNYLLPLAQTAPPSKWDGLAGVQKGTLFGNDKAGDCVLATVAQLRSAWSIATHRTPDLLKDADVLAEYSRLSGWNPQTGAHDGGLVILDVLKRWRKGGLFGNKLRAFMSVNRHSLTEVYWASWRFNGLFTGCALPQAAQQQIREGQPWRAPRYLWGSWAPGSWGGHALPILRYDAQYLTFRTWGQDQPCSPYWLQAYCDEAYVLVDELMFDDLGRTSSGFDLEQLLQDLQQV